MNFLTRLRSVLTAACLVAIAIPSPASAEIKLIGSGASFPAPIYSKWFKDFSGANKSAQVDYQSKGSGAG